MNVIVDIQGFKNDCNQFILKEIAIQSGIQVMVLLFKPPFPFYNLTKTERRQVCWIEGSRNVLWNDGFIPYHNHKPYIKDLLENKTIYVKGTEKIIWLRNILDENYLYEENRRHIYNLEDYGCPSLLSLHEKYISCLDVYSCIYHSTACALKNVNCLHKWNLENKCF